MQTPSKRWLLTSWGSRGDLHPFLALGRGLIARGHQVTLVGHPEWEMETKTAGLRFVSTQEHPREDLIRKHPEIVSMKYGGLTSFRALVHRGIVPSFDCTMTALLAEAPNHDIMVTHHFVLPAEVVSDMTGIPRVTVSLAPGVIPSAYALPGPSFRLVRARHGIVSRAVNRVIWSGGQLCACVMVDPIVNRLRRKHGLAPTRNAVFGAHSSLLNLQLYSEHFASRSPDWTEEKKFGGFCFYDPPDAPALAPDVEEFLSRGEPPVLFTLGSTAVQNPGLFYPMAVEALEGLGLRGILLFGPEENRPARVPDTILAVPYAPFGPLMPHVRAVVHQCGIGTLSHTLRAGVPAVAYPFAFDQPNNARRLEALGVAEVILPHQRTVKHLRQALQRLLSGDAPAHARHLGETIRAQDGVSLACDILEKAFQ
jgi:UDP:flavonoid glycosyltransferase YjiC (YdhE family)